MRCREATDRGMKKFIIIFAVLVLLLGGAGAAAYLGYIPLDFGADATAQADDAPTERIEMDPFTMPVIRAGALKGEVTLSISLEVRPGAEKFRVWRFQRELRDAYIMDLHALLSLNLDGTGFLESEFIRKRLQGIADKIIGRGFVRSVLVYKVRAVT